MVISLWCYGYTYLCHMSSHNTTFSISIQTLCVHSYLVKYTTFSVQNKVKKWLSFFLPKKCPIFLTEIHIFKAPPEATKNCLIDSIRLIRMHVNNYLTMNYMHCINRIGKVAKTCSWTWSWYTYKHIQRQFVAHNECTSFSSRVAIVQNTFGRLDKRHH